MNPVAAIGAVLALVVVFLGGRACGQVSQATALADCREALGSVQRTNGELSEALQAVNVEAARTREQAERQQERAIAAVMAAQEAGAYYARRLGEIEGGIEMAKQRDPVCREVLESQTCAVLQ